MALLVLTEAVPRESIGKPFEENGLCFVPFSLTSNQVFSEFRSGVQSLHWRNTMDWSWATEERFGTRMSDFGVFPRMDINRKMAGSE